MKDFWPRANEKLRSGENVFVALVAESSAHSPGTAGARLALFESGDTIGTIGGGVMEYALLSRGRTALTSGSFEPELVVLNHRSNGEGIKSGMMCSGQQTNLYYLLKADTHLEVTNLARASVEAGDAGIIQFESTGVSFQPESDPTSGQQSWLESAGGRWRYFEQLLNLHRVGIFGGGHCGLALSKTMADLGYYVTILDNRPDLPTMKANIWADERRVAQNMDDAASLISHPQYTAILIMTTDVSSDIPALKGALKRPFPFVGVMGSEAKIGNIKKRLAADGVPDFDLNRITGPVGVPMKSNSPAQIAVSIAAQLLQKDEV